MDRGETLHRRQHDPADDNSTEKNYAQFVSRIKLSVSVALGASSNEWLFSFSERFNCAIKIRLPRLLNYKVPNPTLLSENQEVTRKIKKALAPSNKLHVKLSQTHCHKPFSISIPKALLLPPHKFLLSSNVLST